jgi:CheY-like chemotaxis protein
MVLDDNPGQLEWLMEVFKTERFEVTGFTSGQELMDSITNDLNDMYAAVLLDLILLKDGSQMEEEMQGTDYCLEIKRLKPYLPVFAITADTSPQRIANTILNFGFDGFIAKDELRTRPHQYFDHLKSSINSAEPQLKSIWRDIVGLTNYAEVIRSKLLGRIQERVRTAYFFLLQTDSHPLLTLLLPGCCRLTQLPIIRLSYRLLLPWRKSFPKNTNPTSQEDLELCLGLSLRKFPFLRRSRSYLDKAFLTPRRRAH